MVKETRVRRGEVYLVSLGPVKGGEIRKTRPCVIVSPDELNLHLRTHIVAPMTTGSYSCPFRVSCQFNGRAGHIVLDQIRTVNRSRLVKKLGHISSVSLNRSLGILSEMFSR